MADADRGDLAARRLLDEVHVGTGGLGEVLKGAGAGDVLLPARHVLVDGLGVVEVGLARGEFGHPLAVDLVGNADGDFIECAQDVQLRQEEIREAVHSHGVAGDEDVEPTAAAVAAGGDAHLAANGAQCLAVLVEQFSGEGSGAHTGGVSLEDPQRAGDARGADSRTRAGTAGGGVGRRDERVGAVVDVQQRSLGSFEKNHVAAIEGLVKQQRRVHDVRAQRFGVTEHLLDDAIGVDRPTVENLHQELVTRLECGFDFCLQDAGVEEVLNANADAPDLVHVRRADASARGADARFAQESFADLVHLDVVRGDQVGVGADP